MAAGNRHLGYKEALNAIEDALARHQGGVLLRLPRARAAERFARRGRPRSTDDAAAVQRCGAPTPGEVCAFCRLVERAAGAEPVHAQPCALGHDRRGVAARGRGEQTVPRRRAGAAVDSKSGATSSPSPTAASSTPTPASSAHDDIIGQPEGVVVRIDRKARLLHGVRPTLGGLRARRCRAARR